MWLNKITWLADVTNFVFFFSVIMAFIGCCSTTRLSDSEYWTSVGFGNSVVEECESECGSNKGGVGLPRSQGTVSNICPNFSNLAQILLRFPVNCFDISQNFLKNLKSAENLIMFSNCFNISDNFLNLLFDLHFPQIFVVFLSVLPSEFFKFPANCFHFYLIKRSKFFFFYEISLKFLKNFRWINLRKFEN